MGKRRWYWVSFMVVWGLLISNLPAAAPASVQAGVAPVGLSAAAWQNIQAQIMAADTPSFNGLSGDGRGLSLLTERYLMPTIKTYLFGNAVAIDNDIAVVGCYMCNNQAGKAFIFYRNGAQPDEWVLKKELLGSTSGDGFGYAVDVSGDTVAVSAWRKAEGELGDVGEVYIYQRHKNGYDNWGQTSYLIPTPTLNYGRFGTSLALYGDQIIVGAPYSGVGAAYLFARNQGGLDYWWQVKYFSPADGASGDYFGWDVDLSQDIAVVSAPNADISSQADQGAAYVFYRNDNGADQWGQRAKVTSGLSNAAGQLFGSALSLAGDTLVVGAPGTNGSQGEVYILQRNQNGGNLWGVAQSVHPADLTGVGQFGADVSLERDTLLVGAPTSDAPETDQGAAYVFERNQGGAQNWGQVHRILSPSATADDQFGNRVALSGNGLIVAAWADDPASSLDGGTTYFYRLTGGRWLELVKRQEAAPDPAKNLGWSVALDNDLLAVGAPKTTVNSVNESGAAYLFRRNHSGADSWTLIKVLAADDPVAGDQFGNAVAVHDDLVAVGAYLRGGGAGGVYIFSRNQDGADLWGQVTKLSGAAGERFGTSLALSGDRLAVGASGTLGSSDGAAYLFERNQDGQDAWGQRKAFPAPATGGNFGYSVALDNDTLLVGMPYSDSADADAGTAYLYERNQGGSDAWGQVKQFLAHTTGANDHFGFAVALQDDLVAIGAPDADRGAETDAGAVDIFYGQVVGVSWGYVTTLSPSVLVASDRFGYDLDVDGDRLLVGAPRRQVGSNLNQGGAYLFDRNQGGLDAWGQTAYITVDDGAAEDRLGFSVSLDTQFLALGAINADYSSYTEHGAVYIFRFQQYFEFLPLSLRNRAP